MNEIPAKIEKPKPLRPGDVVRYKSGGPPMTVSFVDPDYFKVECGWFWRSTYHTGMFQAAELTRIAGDEYYQTTDITTWRGTEHHTSEPAPLNSPGE